MPTVICKVHLVCVPTSYMAASALPSVCSGQRKSLSSQLLSMHNSTGCVSIYRGAGFGTVYLHCTSMCSILTVH